ncbi:hypothetical protein [Streptomyces sp. AB3(2024)]|uniref:DUF6891 domain-containing protein n=1 Tax=Streptomyces sp. AB3(2024) TaxID=3317321 RepID=UPI0035A265F7
MQAIKIRIETESDGPHDDPGLTGLTELVERIGADGDRFLVVTGIPEDPGVFVQVWHEAGGDYQLEHRAGAPDRHFRTFVATAAEVVAVMARWVRQEADWDLGPVWKRLEFPVEEVPPLDPAIEEQLTGIVRNWLRAGYHGLATLVEEAEDNLVADGVRPVSRAQAELLVNRLWRERVAEQSGWSGETDPERLGRAFAALEAAGITARENFACCRGCGLAEIRGDGLPDARGFVFFHSQCTEGAADGGDLYLLYGGFATSDGAADDAADDAADEARTAAVGREVTAALDAVGLTWAWDGSAHDAIRVTGLDWRKRLTG